MATETNLQFTLGETWVVDFALNDAAGADLDLTGATVAFRLFRRKVRVLQLTSAGSEIVLDASSPPTGNGTLTVAPIDQAGLVAAVYDYEVRATLADGSVTTQAFGALTLADTLF